MIHKDESKPVSHHKVCVIHGNGLEVNCTCLKPFWKAVCKNWYGQITQNDTYHLYYLSKGTQSALSKF